MTARESFSARELTEELLNLTRQMALKTDDVDFLLQGVDRRQALMDEFDKTTADDAECRKNAELRRMVDEIISLDKVIGEALIGHREHTKQDVSASNQQKRILSYTNQAISSSGSYMDYKK